MVALMNSVGLWPLLGSALPLLVALFTKRETKSGVQGAAFALLAALAGVAEALVKSIETHTAFEYKTAVLAAVAAWVIGQTAHSNLWKSTGLAAKLQAFGTAARKLEAELPASVKADLSQVAEAVLAHLQSDATGKHAAEPAPEPAPEAAKPSQPIGFSLPDPESAIPEEYPIETTDANYPALP